MEQQHGHGGELHEPQGLIPPLPSLTLTLRGGAPRLQQQHGYDDPGRELPRRQGLLQPGGWVGGEVKGGRGGREPSAGSALSADRRGLARGEIMQSGGRERHEGHKGLEG